MTTYKIGDKVKITDNGEIYPCHSTLFIKLGFRNTDINNIFTDGAIGTIFGIDKTNNTEKYALNLDNGEQCLIEVDGITRVVEKESKYKLIKDLPDHKIGDIKTSEHWCDWFNTHNFPINVIHNAEWFKELEYIFTTKDGVDMYIGDRYFWLHNINFINTTIADKFSGKNKDCTYFSTREAAEEFIAKRKKFAEDLAIFELLREAKQKYPIGIKFKGIGDSRIFKVTGIHYDYKTNVIWSDNGIGRIYDNDKWAEIIKKPTFKVGDYVVITKGHGNWANDMTSYIGKVAQLKHVNKFGGFYIDLDDDSWTWFYENGHFRAATQEEIDEATKKPTEVELWRELHNLEHSLIWALGKKDVERVEELRKLLNI